jgi:hypothetical protein
MLQFGLWQRVGMPAGPLFAKYDIHSVVENRRRPVLFESLIAITLVPSLDTLEYNPQPRFAVELCKFEVKCCSDQCSSFPAAA